MNGSISKGSQWGSVLRGQRSSCISTLSSSCGLGSGDAGIESCSSDAESASRSLSSMTTGATVHSAISNHRAAGWSAGGTFGGKDGERMTEKEKDEMIE